MKSLLSTILILGFAAEAGAQSKQWQIITTFSGRAAGFFSPNNTELIVRDFDGDQVPDNIFTRRGTGGGILNIISGANQSEAWALPCAPFAGSQRFIGFYNFDGIIDSDNPKEVLMAKGPQRNDPYLVFNIKLSSGTCDVFNIESGTVLLSVADIDKDGIAEVVVADPGKNEIQIWALR